jgi:hypothetical protein
MAAPKRGIKGLNNGVKRLLIIFSIIIPIAVVVLPDPSMPFLYKDYYMRCNIEAHNATVKEEKERLIHYLFDTYSPNIPLTEEGRAILEKGNGSASSIIERFFAYYPHTVEFRYTERAKILEEEFPLLEEDCIYPYFDKSALFFVVYNILIAWGTVTIIFWTLVRIIVWVSDGFKDER